MRQIDKTRKFEKALVLFLNTFDHWNLEWNGQSNLPYDAKGFTPKGNKCVIEMKFRKTYYEDKMLEVKKYNDLMELPEDVVKIYFVSDPKGNYWFWLDKLKELNIMTKKCPVKTYWNSNRVQKEVYLLPESQASIFDISNEEKIGVWDEYFKLNKK